MDRPGRRPAWEGTLGLFPIACAGRTTTPTRDDRAEPGDEFTDEGAAEAVRPADDAGSVVSGRGRRGGGVRPGDSRTSPGPDRRAGLHPAGRLGADHAPVTVPPGLQPPTGSATGCGRTAH